MTDQKSNHEPVRKVKVKEKNEVLERVRKYIENKLVDRATTVIQHERLRYRIAVGYMRSRPSDESSPCRIYFIIDHPELTRPIRLNSRDFKMLIEIMYNLFKTCGDAYTYLLDLADEVQKMTNMGNSRVKIVYDDE